MKQRDAMIRELAQREVDRKRTDSRKADRKHRANTFKRRRYEKTVSIFAGSSSVGRRWR